MRYPTTPPRSVLWVVDNATTTSGGWVELLRNAVAEAGWLAPGADQVPDLVIFWSDQPTTTTIHDELMAWVAAGSRLLVCGPSLSTLHPGSALAEATGLVAGEWSPLHEVRVRSAGSFAWSLASASEPTETVLPSERVLTIEKVMDDVDVLLTANLALVDHPVATYRASTRTGTFTLAGADADGGERRRDPSRRDVSRLLLKTMNHAMTCPEDGPPNAVRVGLLGFGAIGAEHSRALLATPGLELVAVCDRSPERLEQARLICPDAAQTTDPEVFVARTDLDLVVISTPPDSHAAWAIRVLESGRHVVLEKPFALSTEEADTVLELAASRGLLAVVYQNRRFDPDFLAIQRLVEEGQLGTVFRAEAFIGGHGHPCNFWHSDERISGGAIFDWGAHVLDQLLELFPGDIDFVTASERKLLWHDVTNADHSRVTVTFVDGTEVEFVHSDAAAALKPRWYILGTAGAVVGRWRTEKVIARSEVGTLSEDVMAPADSPPNVYFHCADGSVTSVATPASPPFAFHQELVDLLHLGIPMTVTGHQSRRVLAVMEAARKSAGHGGHPVPLA